MNLPILDISEQRSGNSTRKIHLLTVYCNFLLSLLSSNPNNHFTAMYASYLSSLYSYFSCNFLFYFPYVRIGEELSNCRARVGNIISIRNLVIPQQEEVQLPTVTQLVNPLP
jgi:hypothetical protein